MSLFLRELKQLILYEITDTCSSLEELKQLKYDILNVQVL